MSRDYLSTLRSLQAPHEPMPRLADLLAWLAQPEREGIWLLLDIKLDDDPAALFAAVAEVVASVDAGRWARSWRERIVVGGWNVRVFPFPFGSVCCSFVRSCSTDRV